MSSSASARQLFIGLMSGTSLDGVDGALASFASDGSSQIETLSTAYLPFSTELRVSLLTLQSSGQDEIQRESLAANSLARLYAECILQLLAQTGIAASDVIAIGAHGQTIRHQPALGYSRQTNQPALLAELAGIDVIADFRSRDIAAGGQGAPLVPAFHHAVFSVPEQIRVVANIGGIANISILTGDEATVTGFDTGPGNVLMDGWTSRHLGQRYDADGAWASQGAVLPELLQDFHSDDFFTLPPPKSTGRDLFHANWLDEKLKNHPHASPVDVQATLAAFTAETLAEAIARYAPEASALYVCGGGACNGHLMRQIGQALHTRKMPIPVESTAELGMAPNHVEALAFAWLAYRFHHRQAGNLPAVTGANGPRILGALYPTA
jgi:anhydro-N-acetylmuramic acid kinase